MTTTPPTKILNCDLCAISNMLMLHLEGEPDTDSAIRGQLTRLGLLEDDSTPSLVGVDWLERYSAPAPVMPYELRDMMETVLAHRHRKPLLMLAESTGILTDCKTALKLDGKWRGVAAEELAKLGRVTNGEDRRIRLAYETSVNGTVYPGSPLVKAIRIDPAIHPEESPLYILRRDMDDREFMVYQSRLDLILLWHPHAVLKCAGWKGAPVVAMKDAKCGEEGLLGAVAITRKTG